MAHTRTSDLALLLGHTMQCEDCREQLLKDPQRAAIGRKMSEDQRERLLALQPEDFENSVVLAGAVGLEVNELIEATNHPRARLRHI